MTIKDLPAFTQRLVDGTAEKVEGQVAVVIWQDGTERPYAGVFGNPTGAVAMVRTLLEVNLAQERATDCLACSGAWDRMKQALAVLEAGEDGETCH